MKKLFFVAAFSCCSLPVMYAQLPPQRQASPEAKERMRERADYKEFRKQLVALKEFSDEKKKVPKLQKDSKEPVKIVATIDSVDGGDDVKTLTGYITQQIGDNSTNAYEVVFDRATKKITSVKKTGDATEPEVAEPKAKPTAKPAADKKKPATAKKKTDEDGDDEEEPEDQDEKPSKTNKKDDGE